MITIWTYLYRPFVMGGNVYQAIGCQVEPTSGPHPVGYGYNVYEVVSPIGKTYVVEESSGGIVGDSLKAVADDMATATERDIHRSVAQARERAKTVQMIDVETFWGKFR